ncbi:MAG: hypothetical protein JWP88_1843 [Flaviaesturariibacter sp.]|nr:hypothetical protein [Flaviaesturariibacter sp.]
MEPGGGCKLDELKFRMMSYEFRSMNVSITFHSPLMSMQILMSLNFYS